jgi:hypothetical protein
MFKLEIETGNEAFAEDPGAELARMLRVLAGRLAIGLHTSDKGTLRDSNGNRVGSWSYEESSE